MDHHAEKHKTNRFKMYRIRMRGCSPNLEKGFIKGLILFCMQIFFFSWKVYTGNVQFHLEDGEKTIWL